MQGSTKYVCNWNVEQLRLRALYAGDTHKSESQNIVRQKNIGKCSRFIKIANPLKKKYKKSSEKMSRQNNAH